jgi:OPT oligopeptide transporter protein
MTVLSIILACVLSFFSTVIMSYIAMATAIGPWIETTLILIGMLILYMLRGWYSAQEKEQILGLSAAAGGICGILATACGFSFPTLYFIDKPFFCSLMGTPLTFATLLTLLACAAGSWGLLLAHIFEHTLIVKQQAPFPLGELMYKMIAAADDMRKAAMLAVGFISSQLFLFIRTGVQFLSQPIVLLKKYSFGALTIPGISLHTDTIALFWAIGFVTGHVIALPLFLGILVNYLVIGPLYYVYPAISSFLTSAPPSFEEFRLAFSGGMVIYGAIFGFLELPKVLKSTFTHIYTNKAGSSVPWFLGAAILILNSLVLSYFDFSFLGQVYLLIFTLVCGYQLMLIAGKLGLAPLGRFATFVMVPGMFLFAYTPLQTTLVASYVEIATGIGCAALFGRKMGHLAQIPSRLLERYQWLGLLVGSLCLGVIVWLFINHFGLTSEGALPVIRAQSRAALINVQRFDPYVVALGLLFGYLLKFAKINVTLLLGGIFMSIDYSLPLILGGLSASLVKKSEEYFPFWSGVFAANSLWMLLKVFF